MVDVGYEAISAFEIKGQKVVIMVYLRDGVPMVDSVFKQKVCIRLSYVFLSDFVVNVVIIVLDPIVFKVNFSKRVKDFLHRIDLLIFIKKVDFINYD